MSQITAEVPAKHVSHDLQADGQQGATWHFAAQGTVWATVEPKRTNSHVSDDGLRSVIAKGCNGALDKFHLIHVIRPPAGAKTAKRICMTEYIAEDPYGCSSDGCGGLDVDQYTQLLHSARRLHPEFTEQTRTIIGRFYLASRKVRSASCRSGTANEIHKEARELTADIGPSFKLRMVVCQRRSSQCVLCCPAPKPTRTCFAAPAEQCRR